MSPRALPGWPPGPGPTPPAQAQAAHQAQLAATLARAVTNSERYLRALRVPDAAARAARQQRSSSAARPDATRRNQLDTLALAGHARYASRLTTQPYALIRPGLTPQERLWQHVVANMPYELALMTRLDPVTRSVGGAVVAVGSVQAAPLAYSAVEEATLAGLQNGAALLENNGAAILAHLRAVTLKTFLQGAVINGVGQGVGNYIVKHDAIEAGLNINLLSAAASGLGVPLTYNALFSAGFSFSPSKGFKSIATGSISAYEFERDAVFNYAFGKVAAGFKLPEGWGGRAWFGLNNLPKTQLMSDGVGFGTYQAMLRLGPATGYGMGVGLNTGLEQGNRILLGAAKKVLSAQLKEKLPDAHKKP